MKSVLLSLCMTMALGALAQQPVQFKLTIKNFKSTEGKIRAAMFSDEDSYLKTPTFAMDTVIYNTETVVLVFGGVPNGEYAISIYHDLNENKELDANFMGIPTEPYAFSNNAPSRFGPAKYNEAKILINETNNEHSITLN